MHDHPRAYQTYMDIPIKGNFIKYFYLIKAHGKWGKEHPHWLRHGINGYVSSFMATFDTRNVDPGNFLDDERFSSNIALAAVGGFLAAFVLFFIPLYRRYGFIYPALLTWLVLGSAFIFWWEPLYIEHWIYITILTWVLVFMVADTLLESTGRSPIRIIVSLILCVSLWSLAAVVYHENLTHMVSVQERLFLPSNAYGRFWKDEYTMDEIYRTLPRDD
jgi:hypothetical protein